MSLNVSILVSGLPGPVSKL